MEIMGDGNGGPVVTSGWVLIELNLGVLVSGTHTFTLGAFNNKKTFNNEETVLLIDDVTLEDRGIDGLFLPLAGGTMLGDIDMNNNRISNVQEIQVTDGSSNTIINPSFISTDKLLIKDWAIEVPDYVFSQKYRLPKLKELESFIQKNSHLPNFPSGKSLKKDGINVAKMNFLLLKQLEEMTLHMIKLDKRINELELNENE